MQVLPYLFFDGRCDEAIEFYRGAIGAEVLFLMRFKDAPESMRPGTEENVMHATLKIGETSLHVSDGRCMGKASYQGFGLSLTVAGEAEAQRLFTALSDGGHVQMPMAKTFFSPQFGMVIDRFGVLWMVHVSQ